MQVNHRVLVLLLTTSALGCHAMLPLSAPSDAPPDASGDLVVVDSSLEVSPLPNDAGDGATPKDIKPDTPKDHGQLDVKLDTMPKDTTAPDVPTVLNDTQPSVDTSTGTCSHFSKDWTQIYCSTAQGCSYTCTTKAGNTYVVTCEPKQLMTIGMCSCSTNSTNDVLCGPRMEKNNICYYPCNYWATLKSCCLP